MQDHGDGAILEAYNYLGYDTIVQKNRPQPGVALSSGYLEACWGAAAVLCAAETVIWSRHWRA